MSGLMRWDPFQDSSDLVQRFNRLLGAAPGGAAATAEWRPVANITENDTHYLIKAELPGVKKDDIRIEVADGVLSLKGERRAEKEHKDDTVHRIESFYGSFSRSFRLPEDVDVEGISAESADGVLQVRLPKTKASKPKSVQIQVK